MTATSSQYIPTLDGWRAVAILMVLFSHGLELSNRLPFEIGFSGVNIFFVLSGILITERLLADYTVDGRIQFKKFYIRRACRILPPVFVYLAVISVLGFGFHLFPLWKWEIVGSALFARNYILVPHNGHALYGWFTGHFWSLAVEEHYYLLWPLVIHIAGKSRARWAAILGACICALWRFIGWGHGISQGYLLDRVPYFFRTDVRLDGLLLGSLIGLLYADGGGRAVLARFIRKRDMLPLLVLYFLVLFTMYELGSIKELLLVAAMLTLTVLHPDVWLGRILELAPVRWVGRISYSLYIWQQLFLVWPEGGRPLHALNIFPLNLILTFVVASLSYRLIERPMIRLGYRITSGTRPRDALTTVSG